jgi:ATP-dependent exoDNAse (exonuclease V) beta subunit
MVRVMTVHGSKGLQFKRVILVDFDGPARNVGRAGDLIWDRKVGVHLINREATGEQVKDDPENLKWKELEKRASIAESKRLFYVALTRSQEQLILLWKREVKASKKAEEAGFNPFLEDNWRAWVAKVEVPHRLVLDSNAAKIEKPAGEPPRLPDPLREIDFDAKPYRARHSPSEWRVLDQCSLRYRMKFSQSEHLPDEDRQSKKIENEGEASEPRQFLAEKGERIHRAIEKGDDEALIREFKTPEVGQRAVTLLRSFLRNEPEVEVFAELGFEVPLSAREALVGMMDRLEIERDSQVIRVIDYKYTAQAVPPEKLLEAYSLQLKLYAWAAMRLSGFEPARIEGFLVHFTENDASVIEAPSSGFEKAHLEAEVDRMHQQSQNPSPTPRVGEYCRFCEWVSACPEQTLGKG